MTLSSAQSDLATLLGAAAGLAGLSVLSEGATTLKADIETALNAPGKGVVIIVQSPGGGVVAEGGTSRGIEVIVPVAVLHNGPISAATGGAGKTPMQLVEAVIKAALAGRWDVETDAFRRVEFEGGGITAYLVLISRTIKQNAA